MHDAMAAEAARRPNTGPRSLTDQRVMVESHLVAPCEKAVRLWHRGPRGTHGEPISDATPVVLVARSHHPQPAVAFAKMKTRARLEGHRHRLTEPIVWTGLEHAALHGLDLQGNAKRTADLRRPDAARHDDHVRLQITRARLSPKPEVGAQRPSLFDVTAKDLERHIQAVQRAVVGALDPFGVKPGHYGARVRMLDRQPTRPLEIGPAPKVIGHLGRLCQVQVSVGLKVDVLGPLDEEAA